MSELNQGAQAAPPATGKPPVRRAGKPTGLRKWVYRVLAMTVVPALVLGLLEASLRLSGYGYSTDFFLDGTKTEDASVWVDNPDFGRWVFPSMDRTPQPVPFALAKAKPKGTVRIFVLGESAAMGFPDPSTSFARVLKVLLRAAYPDRQFEVVNAAMVAINSHVVLRIARACARQEPDLFVVHLGNNEVVGPFGAAGVLGPFSPHRRVIGANLALKTSRMGQLLNRTMQSLSRGNQASRSWQGMTMFANSHVRADDSRLPGIRTHFRENLHEICSAAAEAGAGVILCSIPVNLGDCAPFGSQHAPELDEPTLATWETTFREGVRLQGEKGFAEALRHYEEAAKQDEQFAELAYRRGRCFAALGRRAEADKCYRQARDLDTLRFRSDSRINDTIRDVAAARAGEGVCLADAERTFDEASPDGVAGEELFLEHVHMNFKGNWLLARTVFQAIADLAPACLGTRGPEGEPLSERQCAKRLAHTVWNEHKIAGQIHTMLTEQSPFTLQFDWRQRGERWKGKIAALKARLETEGMQKIVAEHQKATEGAPGDWMMHLNFGQVLTEHGALLQAEEQYQAALVALRHCYAARCKLGNLLANMGRTEEAAYHFKEALRLAPNYTEAIIGLAEALAAEGSTDEAQALYERQVRADPHHVPGLVALGLFLKRAGKLDEAQKLFQQASELEPNNPTIFVYQGDVAVKQGQRDEALAHYEAALKLRPEWPELRDYLARMRKERK
jgi:tetratricopeptide (TPR) repeat protein